MNENSIVTFGPVYLPKALYDSAIKMGIILKEDKNWRVTEKMTLTVKDETK